eukprot:397258_1
MGMIYNFPHLKWNLKCNINITRNNRTESAINDVYTCSCFYFNTYHILGNIIIRVVSSLLSSLSIISVDVLNKCIGVVTAAYLCAYGELWRTTIGMQLVQLCELVSIGW